MSEPTFADMWARFDRSAARHAARAVIHADIGRIIEPYEMALIAIEKAGLRAKRVRMPREALSALRDAHERLAAEQGEPPYDIVTLYGLPIIEVNR